MGGGMEVSGVRWRRGGVYGVYSLRSLWKRRYGCVFSHLVPRETRFRFLRTGEKIKTHGENLESAKATCELEVDTPLLNPHSIR